MSDGLGVVSLERAKTQKNAEIKTVEEAGGGYLRLNGTTFRL